ncbi:3-hydroxyacyl-CoA dehydrogenase [Durotheca rogersii]|uniref:3-hydroxyacyl-CoA dehydrogenase n=1 Tax=Durotheca rogersii TaxID=419775 RepID=UPI0022209E04|nr:3-hydroxyacyl-CoA dehydrogenase [Durotheca rogersii]KAI5867651.1 3-hydroxyacyl-CoA dehydrogenase [Durotheca rogersii]
MSDDRLYLFVIDVGLNTPNFMDAANAGRVLFANPNEHSRLRTLIKDQHLPDGIDVSLRTARIFWGSMGMPNLPNGAVFSCGLDGTAVETILPRGSVHTPKQLVVDDEGSKIYIADREGMKIIRCNLDGSQLEVLVHTGDESNSREKTDPTRWCVGVAISRPAGKLYWTQKGPSKGNQGRIFRANLDFLPGQTAKSRTDIECLLQNLPEPINLCVDEGGRSLYWTDRGELPLGNSINRLSLDAARPIKTESNVVSWPGRDYELLVRNMHEAIGIKLDINRQYIYATDLGGRIYRFNMDGGEEEIFYENEGSYAGITIV